MADGIDLSQADQADTPPQLAQILRGQGKWPNLARTHDHFDTQADQYQENAIINGNFQFWQRQTPTDTLTAYNDDTYHADRWVGLSQTAVNGYFLNRITGDKTPYALNIIPNGSNRVGALQIIESIDSIAYREAPVTFEFKAQTHTSAITAMAAIIEWTGTADIVTSDVVNDWTKTDYITPGQFFIGTNIRVVAVTQCDLVVDVWQKFKVQGTISSSCNNIMVFAWKQSAGTQVLRITEAQFHRGLNAPGIWRPRPIGLELALCQRYYRKSYDLETKPGTNAANGYIMFVWGGQGALTRTKTLFIPARNWDVIAGIASPVWTTLGSWGSSLMGGLVWKCPAGSVVGMVTGAIQMPYDYYPGGAVSCYIFTESDVGLQPYDVYLFTASATVGALSLNSALTAASTLPVAKNPINTRTGPFGITGVAPAAGNFFHLAFARSDATGLNLENVYFHGVSIEYQAVASSAQTVFTTSFGAAMRAVPTVTVYDYVGNSGKITMRDDLTNNVNNISPGVVVVNDEDFLVLYNGATSYTGIVYQYTVEAEL